jgi:DNA-binding NtrC family response regulator
MARRDAQRWFAPVLRSTSSPAASTVEFARFTGSAPSAQPWESSSTRHREALAQLKRWARQSDVTILLEGESGTGKSHLARQVHAHSPRAGRAYQEVRLAALDDNLAGSDLFGHVAGAFTDAKQHRAGAFVTANGGTLFLDEIGKASPAVQRKLLHVVEDGTLSQYGSDRSMRVDVRIVAATNIPLAELVRAGSFLPDLAPRLGLFRLRLLPLRERREDIAALATEIVARRAPKCGYRSVPAIGPDLMRALERAEWPMNVRELDATLHRILVDADGAPTLALEHCTGDLEYLRPLGRNSRGVTRSETLAAIEATSDNKSAAGKMLGVSRSTVYRRLQGSGG